MAKIKKIERRKKREFKDVQEAMDEINIRFNIIYDKIDEIIERVNHG